MNMNEITSEIEKINEDVKRVFGNLSTEQINWKPSAEGWSVGQCFEHLVKSNNALFPTMDSVGNGTHQNSFWQNWSPFTKFGGSFLLKSLKSDDKKFKAPTKDIVPPSEIEGNIIEKFVENNRHMSEKIEKTANVDWKKTVVTSPFLSIMTYTLEDAYQIIVEHEKRHFRQAERVLQTEGFPK